MEFKVITSNSFDKELLEDFRKIYLASFLDKNESEPYDSILERIRSHDSFPATIATILTDEGKTVGGLVSDYYLSNSNPKALDLEIIYLAVAPEYRKKGFGSALIGKGLEISVSAAEKETGRKVRRVYFETENPFLVKVESFDPVARLKFFANIGARRIPVEYKQPPLAQESGWAENLFLMTLPLDEDEKYVKKDEVEEFLHEFYRGLGVTDYTKLKEMDDELSLREDKKGRIELEDLREHSMFRIGGSSVLFHYRVYPENSGFDEEYGSRQCSVFGSYECDLMDYTHQTNPPFKTCHEKTVKNVQICLPAFYKYTSEGRSTHRISEQESINADISINYSYRPGAVDINEKYIMSVVVSPADGCTFNELSLIKLISVFGSRQENFEAYVREEEREDGVKSNTTNRGIDSAFKIRLPDNNHKEGLSPAEFLKAHVTGGSARFECLRVGVSELELSMLTDSRGGKVFKSFDDFYSEAVCEDPVENEWNKALCGILLGIFDFGRMNSSEIYDTLKPVVKRKSSISIMSRGHLARIKYQSEEEYERVDKIFMSPYLIIPDIALVYKEMALDKNEAKLERPLEILAGSKIRKKPHRRYYFRYFSRIQAATEELQKIQISLSSEYVDSCFHYESERAIMEAGELQRGLKGRHVRLNHLVNIRLGEIAAHKAQYSSAMDAVQNAILMILAVMQVVVAFKDNMPMWLKISSTVGIVAICLLWGIWRAKRQLDD